MMIRGLMTLIVAGAVAGCVTGRSGGDVALLRGIDWRLVELNGRPAVPADVARRPWIRFDVDSARVAGSGGCNRMSGPVTLDGAAVRFGPLVSTKMACADNALNQQEMDFHAALDRADVYEVKSDTLVLRQGSTALAKLVR